jgi:GTP cyclohydrolase III
MKIFSRKSTSHSDVIAALVKRGVCLEQLRIDAQIALNTAIAARQNYLIAGDLADRKEAAVAQSTVVDAQTVLAGVEDAIQALKPQIASGELAKLSEERRVLAEANSIALANVVRSVEAVLPDWLETAREMSRQLGSLNNFRYQTGGISQYLGDLGSEAEIGLRLILADLAGAVEAVERGEQQITIGVASPTLANEPIPAERQKDSFTYSAPTSGPSYRVLNAFARENR